MRHALLDTLGNAIHGVAAPFACGGTLRLDAPVSLNFRDGLVFPVKPSKGQFDQEKQNAPLIERCAPATDGHGRKTLRDDRERKALQCYAEGGVFTVQGFDPVTSGVLEEVRKQLAPADPNPITAELYALNLYNSDDHFRPHKDPPRGDDMLGTLVVCLPSFFSAGQFAVSHRGLRRVFDWGNEINDDPSPEMLRWAAFFGDVDPSVERLWSGSRVTVSYILRRGEGVRLNPAPPSEEEIFTKALSRALEDPTFLGQGGTIAIPCFHVYSEDPRFQKKIEPLNATTLRVLKGRDQTIARAALAQGLSVELHPYLLEDCADMRWELEHFPTLSQQSKLKKRMDNGDLERVLPIRASLYDVEDPPGLHWVLPPPSFNGDVSLQRPGRPGEDPPEDPDLPAVEHLHDCEHSVTGDFGNEGGDTSFYVYAALHLRIGPTAQRATTTATDESDESAENDGSDESDESAVSAVQATKTASTRAATRAAPKAAKAAGTKAAGTKATAKAPKKMPSAAKSAGASKKSAGTDKESKGAVKKWDWSF